MNLRPLHDWLLVRMDPTKDKIGSIFIPGGEAGNVRTATVIRSGPGKRSASGGYVPTELDEGDKVAFFRWNQEHQQGKQVGALLKEIGDGLALVRVPDVLFTWKPGVTVNVE